MTSKGKGHKGLRDIIKYVIPLIISVGLCYLLFTGIDFEEMKTIIRDQCNFTWIGLALAVAVLSHVMRALRWNIQLRALGIKAPLYALIYSIFGTYAVNLVFPRLGEVWRTGYIAQRQHAAFTTVFGSMVADRLADSVTVLLLTALAMVLGSGEIMSFLRENGESYQAIASFLSSPWLWISVAVCIAALWWFLAHKPKSPFMQKVRAALIELWQGFAVIAKMPGKGRWLLYTVGLWGCYFLQMYLAFFAFPFTEGVLARYGVTAAFVTFVLSSISMGVPSNGGIGPWQWAVIFGLGIYAVPRGEAAAFANLVLGCNTLLLIALGIITFAGIALDRRKTGSVVDKTNKTT